MEKYTLSFWTGNDNRILLYQINLTGSIWNEWIRLEAIRIIAVILHILLASVPSNWKRKKSTTVHTEENDVQKSQSNALHQQWQTANKFRLVFLKVFFLFFHSLFVFCLNMCTEHISRMILFIMSLVQCLHCCFSSPLPMHEMISSMSSMCFSSEISLLT